MLTPKKIQNLTLDPPPYTLNMQEPKFSDFSFPFFAVKNVHFAKKSQKIEQFLEFFSQTVEKMSYTVLYVCLG